MTAPIVRPNLASLLDDLERDPERPAFALRTPYRRFLWSAGQTRAAALALAARLRDCGIRPGDRVLLQGPDGPEWVGAFLGIAAAGAIVVPLEAHAPADLAAKVILKTRASAAVIPRRSSLSLPGVSIHREPLESLDDLRDSPGPFAPPHRAPPEDTAEIVFTSGTTADPKGVELSHANLLSTLAGIEAGFRKRAFLLRPLLPMRFSCLVPLSHLFGQSLGIFVPILMESTAVFSSSLEPRRVLASIRRDRPLAVITVPRVLAAIRDAVVREIERRGDGETVARALARAAGKPAWRRVLDSRGVHRTLGWGTWVFVVGGAALDPEVERFWSGCGFAVIQGYGMTEAAPIVAVHNPLDGGTGTIGRPLGNLEVRIAGDGELLVRGPNVMKGYWDDPGATRDAIGDGWLRTGDLVERDAQGRLRFKGRKKDVIVLSGGLNVHPSDVEQAIEAVRGIREAVAYAGAGPSGDEVHAAVLGSEPLDPDRVREEANARLQPHQHVRRLVVWADADFPRTSTGKVRRGEVAAAARLAGALEKRGVPRAQAEGKVSAALSRLRGGAEGTSDPRARLGDDLGLESLDVLDLVSVLEEEYGAEIPDSAVGSSLTVGALEQLVEKGAADSAPEIAMPRWNRRLPVRVLRRVAGALLLRPAYRIFVKLEIDGLENLRDLEGPVLVVANHESVLDAPSVAFALPGRIGSRLAPAMAVETLADHFDPRGKPLGRRLRAAAWYAAAAGLFAAYPTPQSRGYRPSLEYAGELVDAGWSPLVFPEGRMTRTGRIAPFKAGIGLLASELRVPVLPVRLAGLGAILPPETRRPMRGAARVTFGSPFRPWKEAPDDPAAVALRIESAVRALGAGGD